MGRSKSLLFELSLLLFGLLFSAGVCAQEREEPGKPIGKVSVVGNLIVMELDEGALGQQNLFDLGGRSLHFLPAREGYRVEDLPLQWDSDFGQKSPTLMWRCALSPFPFPGRAGTHSPSA